MYLPANDPIVVRKHQVQRRLLEAAGHSPKGYAALVRQRARLCEGVRYSDREGVGISMPASAQPAHATSG